MVSILFLAGSVVVLVYCGLVVGYLIARSRHAETALKMFLFMQGHSTERNFGHAKRWLLLRALIALALGIAFLVQNWRYR